jgi:peptide-methionine (S)-S-oxide reductase
VFESLLGIGYVNQGWIASKGENSDYSEAVEVYFDPAVISLSDLIEIHLYAHASRSNHSIRRKYRSAMLIKISWQRLAWVLVLAPSEKPLN